LIQTIMLRLRTRSADTGVVMDVGRRGGGGEGGDTQFCSYGLHCLGLLDGGIAASGVGRHGCRGLAPMIGGRGFATMIGGRGLAPMSCFGFGRHPGLGTGLTVIVLGTGIAGSAAGGLAK
jgi:hypothetical protein